MEMNSLKLVMDKRAGKVIPACLLLLVLTGCGDSGPTISEFKVVPNPITAPTQDHPTEFKIGVEAWGSKSCLLTLKATDGEVTDQYEARHFIDFLACEGGVKIDINCKSSISLADARLRDIECATNRATAAQDFKITRPAGSKLDLRVDTDTRNGAKIIITPPLLLILPGMDESSDSGELAVELQ